MEHLKSVMGVKTEVVKAKQKNNLVMNAMMEHIQALMVNNVIRANGVKMILVNAMTGVLIVVIDVLIVKSNADLHYQYATLHVLGVATAHLEKVTALARIVYALTLTQTHQHLYGQSQE